MAYAYRAIANTSFGSGESRSTVSSIVISKSWPHFGQTICWCPAEGLAVLRTGNESPRGHFTNVISPAAMAILSWSGAFGNLTLHPRYWCEKRAAKLLR